MPYINPEDRLHILADEKSISTPGELNYFISTLINWYINEKGKNYATLNEVIGVLECAKLELYRRIAAPYEDSKIQQNGDVYTI
jgi:hypothetical protein